MGKKFSFIVKVLLSEKGRIGHLKRTGDNVSWVLKIVESNDPLFPAFVELIDVPEWKESVNLEIGPVDSSEQTSQSIYDMVREKREKDQAEEAAEELEIHSRLVELAKQDPMRFVCNRYGSRDPVTNPPKADERWHEAFSCTSEEWMRDEMATIRTAVAAIISGQDRLIKETERKLAEAEQMRAVETAADRTSWILDRGSKRLKRLAKEGIPHDSVYREERLAADFPGWQFDYTIADDAARYSQPRNCDDADFELLDKARESFPESVMEFCRIPANEDFDRDGGREEWSGIVATAEFDGKKIVLGCDVE